MSHRSECRLCLNYTTLARFDCAKGWSAQGECAKLSTSVLAQWSKEPLSVAGLKMLSQATCAAAQYWNGNTCFAPGPNTRLVSYVGGLAKTEECKWNLVANQDRTSCVPCKKGEVETTPGVCKPCARNDADNCVTDPCVLPDTDCGWELHSNVLTCSSDQRFSVTCTAFSPGVELRVCADDVGCIKSQELFSASEDESVEKKKEEERCKAQGLKNCGICAVGTHSSVLVRGSTQCTLQIGDCANLKPSDACCESQEGSSRTCGWTPFVRTYQCVGGAVNLYCEGGAYIKTASATHELYRDSSRGKIPCRGTTTQIDTLSIGSLSGTEPASCEPEVINCNYKDVTDRCCVDDLDKPDRKCDLVKQAQTFTCGMSGQIHLCFDFGSNVAVRVGDQASGAFGYGNQYASFTCTAGAKLDVFAAEKYGAQSTTVARLEQRYCPPKSPLDKCCPGFAQDSTRECGWWPVMFDYKCVTGMKITCSNLNMLRVCEGKSCSASDAIGSSDSRVISNLQCGDYKDRIYLMGGYATNPEIDVSSVATCAVS